MAPKFGTSGLRGLVTELTDALVADYVRAFLSVCPHNGQVFIGQDLRPSSPRIAAAVIAAARGQGVACVDCGVVPTPALALAAMGAGASAIMITGSHIPADRNGLKFYVPNGEISKADETAILAAYDATVPAAGAEAALSCIDAAAPYVARYADAFGPDALAGLTIGVYQHSSVARDTMVKVVEALGAKAVPIARSETFIPVDTEAVDQETRDMLRAWCVDMGLDAVISTDGDADRPMLTDADGRVVPGDVLGVVTARLLGAKTVITPVSSNSMVGMVPDFTDVRLTRIGSPYVIAGMEECLAADPQTPVVGFEANGGFLLGFDAAGLKPLMTRDSILPIVGPLVAAKQAGKPLAAFVADLPPRFTAADRVTETPVEAARAFLGSMTDDAAARDGFFADLGPVTHIDRTDGLRLTFGDRVVHLRPSGNAPEFRVYAEAPSAAAAEALKDAYLAKVAAAIRG